MSDGSIGKVPSPERRPLGPPPSEPAPPTPSPSLPSPSQASSSTSPSSPLTTHRVSLISPASSSSGHPTSSVAPVISSSSSSPLPRVPRHIRSEVLEPNHQMNKEVERAMKIWLAISNPPAPSGASSSSQQTDEIPILFIHIDRKGDIHIDCLPQSVIQRSSTKNALFQAGEGEISGAGPEDGRYLFDPKKVAMKLAELDLSHDSCVALVPFVRTIEELFVAATTELAQQGIRGFFRAAKTKLSGTPSIPTQDQIAPLKPGSKPVAAVVAIRGTAYAGGKLTGPEGDPDRQSSCNDWVKVTTHGAIGVADTAGHGRGLVPKLYFPIYEEIFAVFDRCGEELKEYYERTPGLTDEERKHAAQQHLSKELLPLRRRMNQIVMEQDIPLTSAERQKRTLEIKEINSAFAAHGLVEGGRVAELIAVVDKTILQEGIEKLEQKIISQKEAVEAAKEGDLGLLASAIRNYEITLFTLEFYRAVYSENLEKMGELRDHAFSDRPRAITEFSQGLLTARGASPILPELEAERLQKGLQFQIENIADAMGTPPQMLGAPALAFVKVLRTKQGHFLLRLQSSDCTCMRIFPGGRTQIDREYTNAAGFGGFLDRDDTGIDLERAESGEIVSVQSDGVTDFLTLDQLKNVVRNSDPEELNNQLLQEMFTPTETGERLSAVLRPNGTANPVKRLDPTGKGGFNDDYSLARMVVL